MFIFAARIAIMFIGEHIAKLDDKGRLVFPSPLKANATRDDGGKLTFVIKENMHSNCLDMLTIDKWKEKCETHIAKLNTDVEEEHDRVWRAFNKNTAMVEPDEKMGRILIPKWLLDKVNISKEVVFLGCSSKIEVWAKEHYHETDIPKSEVIELMKKHLR